MAAKAKGRKERIIEACDHFLARGELAAGLAVRAYIVKKYGSGPSMRDISPILKSWKESHRYSPAVDRLAEAYFALNEEQQAGFRNRIGVMHKGERRPAGG